MRAREALALPGLTPIERILVGILADHDREVFNPAMDKLTESLYPNQPVTFRSREETRQVLKRLEDKGVVWRHYQTKDNNADDYTHISLFNEPDFPSNGRTPLYEGTNGSTPLNNGNLPSNNGSTPGPKSKRAKKDNAAASEVLSTDEAKALDFLTRTGGGGALEILGERFGVEIRASVWNKVVARLRRDFGVMEIAKGMVLFVNEREQALGEASNGAGYIVKTFPIYLAENIDQVREILAEARRADMKAV